MSEYRPEEIIVQILLRLPVKPLIQFTSVCRSWNSIIKHTSFINAHLNLSQNKTSNNTPSILLRHCPKDPTVERYSLHLDNDSFLELSKPQLPVQSLIECFRIVGSCNGLLLLSDDYHAETNTLILWNPSIRKFVSLPKPHEPTSPYYPVYGFGFDSKKNDYKVVRLVYLRQDDQGQACPEVSLYSLNSGSWKTISATAPNYVIAQTFWSQVFIKGAVHWIASHRKENGLRNVILSFDVSGETFKEIQLPEDLPRQFYNISAAGKSIAVKHYEENTHSIWIMREYGVVDSWTKKFSIDRNVTPNFLVIQIMGCRKNGEFLLEMYDHGGKTGKLVSHDPKNNRNEFLGIHTDPGYSCALSAVEACRILEVLKVLRKHAEYSRCLKCCGSMQNTRGALSAVEARIPTLCRETEEDSRD
ncbi:hypothetical protein ACFX2J_025112 [Malus domestica]